MAAPHPPRLATRVTLISVAALACAGCNADRVLLYPQRQPAMSRHGLRHEIAGPAGTGLELFVVRTAACAGREPEAFVLDLCGNGDRAEWSADRAADLWRDQLVEIWSLNYPGYGGSPGPATVRSLAPAALAVYDHPAAAAPGRPVYLHAVSIGTTAGLRVAAERPVAGIVLQNPPPLRQLLLLYFGWTNLFTVSSVLAAQVPASLDSIANARRAFAPAVFVLAGFDFLVPPMFHRMVLRAYAGPTRVVKLHGALHNTPPRGAQVDEIRAGIDWMTSSPARQQR
jgi:hypothetical protein